MKTSTLFLFLLSFIVGRASSLSSISSKVQKEGTWKPKISNLEERRRLRGINHESELIGSLGFHHIEFYCGDAKSMANQFSLALGMPVTGITGQSTGNDQCVSYGLTSGDVRLLLTAPYSQAVSSSSSPSSTEYSEVQFDAPNPLPQFSPEAAHHFFQKHGLAVRAVGVHVKDAKAAFEASVANGAQAVMEPTLVPTCPGQVKKGVVSKGCIMSEVELYGDVVLRFVSFPDGKTKPIPQDIPFLPHLTPVEGKLSQRESFGIYRIDHAVGNVPNLLEAMARISKFTGFHEFAEFTPEEVGTVESGLNSVVLASDSEDVLFPLNEPTPGR